MEDRARPGWCVVLKKEARGRRITPTELDLGLGQEESFGDRSVLAEMATDRRERADGDGIATAIEEDHNAGNMDQRHL